MAGENGERRGLGKAWGRSGQEEGCNAATGGMGIYNYQGQSVVS